MKNKNWSSRANEDDTVYPMSNSHTIVTAISIYSKQSGQSRRRELFGDSFSRAIIHPKLCHDCGVCRVDGTGAATKDWVKQLPVLQNSVIDKIVYDYFGECG